MTQTCNSPKAFHYFFITMLQCLVHQSRNCRSQKTFAMVSPTFTDINITNIHEHSQKVFISHNRNQKLCQKSKIHYISISDSIPPLEEKQPYTTLHSSKTLFSSSTLLGQKFHNFTLLYHILETVSLLSHPANMTNSTK